MEKNMFLTAILVLSVVLGGCCGLGNVQQKSSYHTKEMVRVCDDTGCRNQLVEVAKEVTTDEPPYQNGYSYMNVGVRLGRRGYIQMGNYNNNYGGYNPYNGGYNPYNGYNGYPTPVWLQRPIPMCGGMRCW